MRKLAGGCALGRVPGLVGRGVSRESAFLGLSASPEGTIWCPSYNHCDALMGGLTVEAPGTFLLKSEDWSPGVNYSEFLSFFFLKFN